MKKKLSFIIPVYNEEENLPLLYEKLSSLSEQFSVKYDSEIIFINDGSKDASWFLIEKFIEIDSTVLGINFTRNFGNQIALTAGYDHATGDAIIALDADLQDPPELVCQMIKQWEQGSYIVYARRSSRNDGFLKTITAFLYYKFLHVVAEVPIPQHVGDFRLIDKRVLTEINNCRERARYLRGMVAWTGFTHSFVEFERTNRVAGKSGYSWAKLIKFAFDGLTNFSLFPLKIAAFIGVFVVATGTAMFLYITYDILVYGTHYPPFKWLVTALYIFTGMQFLLIWLLGEYIGRIYDQQKNRPLYIIQDKKKQDVYSMQEKKHSVFADNKGQS